MTDAAGTGVADAAVMVTRGTAPTPELAIRSRPDGGFGLSLPAGTFTVEAYAGDGRKARAEVMVTNAAVEFDLVLG